MIIAMIFVIKLLVILLFLVPMGCAPTHQLLDSQQIVEQEKEVVRLLITSIDEMRINSAESLDRAEAALELAREVKPGDPRVYDGLGALAVRRGDLDSAHYFFAKAIASDPLYDRGYAHLAYVAASRGDAKVAEELLSIATQLNPVNYRSRNNLAVVLFESSMEKDRAYAELLKAGQSQGVVDSVVEYNLELIRSDK